MLEFLTIASETGTRMTREFKNMYDGCKNEFTLFSDYTKRYSSISTVVDNLDQRSKIY